MKWAMKLLNRMLGTSINFIITLSFIDGLKTQYIEDRLPATIVKWCRHSSYFDDVRWLIVFNSRYCGLESKRNYIMLKIVNKKFSSPWRQCLGNRGSSRFFYPRNRLVIICTSWVRRIVGLVASSSNYQFRSGCAVFPQLPLDSLIP